MNVWHSVAIVAVVAACTQFTRFLPFVLFQKKHPASILYLGKVLPAAIMALLVVYCLKSVEVLRAPHGAAEFISVAVVALLHVWRRNNLLSIGVGTVCYMLLVQCVFV